MGHIKRIHLKDAVCVTAPDCVLSSVHEVFSNLLQHQIMNEIELRILGKLRDTLLPQLISGRVSVNETQLRVKGKSVELSSVK